MQPPDRNRQPHPPGPAPGRQATAQKYHTLLNAAPEIILTFDRNGQITFANQGSLDITGYVKEELLGMNIADILPPDQMEYLKETLFSSASIRRELHLYEAHFINRELTLIPIEINALTIADRDGTVEVLFVGRDIASRKRMERHRLWEQKFDLLEDLVRRLPRDLETMLTPRSSGEKPPFPYVEAYETVDAERAKAALHCHILFAPVMEPRQRKTGSPAEAVRQAAVSAGEDACDLSISDDLRTLPLDVTAVGHAVLNLIRNGREAMKEEGNVAVIAENLDIVPENALSHRPVPPGAYVRITVQDTGGGIPEADLDRIFDPYFSTGNRQGMGLTQVYRIVRQHQGRITVDSRPGRTRISMYLPVQPPEIPLPEEEKNPSDTVSPERKASPMNAEKKEYRLLVMDDEPIVRDVAEQMLQRLGYAVDFAEEGEEAVRLYQQARDAGIPYDLVILDLNVAEGMDGNEALQTLRGIDPDVRCIVSSGYSNEPEMTRFADYGFVAAVTKPYTLQDMERTLNSILT